jgi:ABC-2 type transport system ATP-binding protein
MKAALDIRDLCYRYPAGFALDSVGFSVAPGRFLGLLGRNGAGKSTLVNLLTRLYAPASGTISIDGQPLAERPGAALARLGVVFQHSTLDLDLSVRRNLSYALALYGIAGRRGAEATQAALARFDLATSAARPARALSGGNRRKLEVARALLHRPKLLICDEASVGLDLPSRRALLAHVRALCRDDGMAVVWATHLMDEIEPGDDVVLLQSGRVRATGTAAGLMAGIDAADMAALFEHCCGGEAR